MEAAYGDMCSEMKATCKGLVGQIVKSKEELGVEIAQSQDNKDASIRQIFWRMWILLGSTSLVCIIST